MNKYAFEGETIKLIPAHLEKLRVLYPNLNIIAELEQLDFQLMGKKDWWHAMNGMLKYRNDKAPPKYYKNGNVSHMPRQTRQIPLQQELEDDSWAR